MLAEELWLSKYRHRLNSESSSSSGGGDKASLFNSGKQKAGGHNVKKDPGSSWLQRERRGAKGSAAIVTSMDTRSRNVDQPALLLTTVNAVRVKKMLHDVKPAKTGVTRHVVHLNEEKVFP
jgi:hypothetical protein